MSQAINYLEMRLAKAKNYDEAATIRKMINQWSEKEQEYADRRARPLKIFLQNCDQYYVIMDHVSWQ
jgi:hypothetical protein